MPTVNITNVETVKRGVNANLFHPFFDPITLRLTIMFSSDVFQLPQPRIYSTFQILELRTNQVFEEWRFQANPAPPGIYHWVDLPTAHDLGLVWSASDIFGFRGAVELFSFQRASGLQAVDALDVSEVHWFRVEPVFLL